MRYIWQRWRLWVLDEILWLGVANFRIISARWGLFRWRTGRCCGHKQGNVASRQKGSVKKQTREQDIDFVPKIFRAWQTYIRIICRFCKERTYSSKKYTISKPISIICLELLKLKLVKPCGWKDWKKVQVIVYNVLITEVFSLGESKLHTTCRCDDTTPSFLHEQNSISGKLKFSLLTERYLACLTKDTVTHFYGNPHENLEQLNAF